MTRRRNRTMVPAAAAPTTTATPAGTAAVEISAATAPADEAAGNADVAMDDRVPSAPENAEAGTNDPQVATPANWDKCNEGYCDLVRPGKAMVAAAIVAGRELTVAQRELGGGFDAFIRMRTPWNMAEARTLIQFAAQVGLQPEGLTPSVAVPLERVLEAVTLLGNTFLAAGR